MTNDERRALARRRITHAARLAAAVACFSACSYDDSPMPDAARDTPLAEAIAEGVARACPAAPSDDESARRACGMRLAVLGPLRDDARDPMLWGREGDERTMRLAPLTLRKQYLSLFTFSGEHRLERDGARTVLRVKSRFRNQLRAGSYPYPFWSSKDEWDNCQFSTAVLFVIEEGRVVGARLSADQDRWRTDAPRTFDGRWTWQEDGVPMPEESLSFVRLFSPANEAARRVDAAFAPLGVDLGAQGCFSCHAPDDRANESPLDVLVYPTHALGSRRALVKVLEANTMPPGGIFDEGARTAMLEHARAFERAADEALRIEGEPAPPE